MRHAALGPLGGLVAAAVGLGVCAGCAGSGLSTTIANPAPSGPIRATIVVGQRAGVPVAGEGAVWVPNTGDGTVSRIDPRTNRVTATIRIGDQLAFYNRDCAFAGSVHSFMGPSFHVRDCDLPSALAVTPGALWVLKNDDRTVLQIDPRSNRVVASVPIGFVPFDIAATDGALWITSLYDSKLVRVDTKTNQVVATLDVPDGASGVAATDQVVWVAGSYAGRVSRIDPATNRLVASVVLDCPAACGGGSVPLAVAANADMVWVRTVGDGLLVRIDPATNRVAATLGTIPALGRDGQDHLALLAGSVWVSGVSLQRVDPATNRVIGTVDVNATSVSAGFGSLWITDIFGRIERINP
jgi:YVTN family beta-propeller protein